MTDSMPDFDNMTQEQINEWMESLARRQGATEGFTTAASMAIPEIDPTSVDQSLLEDTYVPFGWSREDWNAYLKKEAAEKQQRAAASVPSPSAPPAPAPPPAQPAARMMTEQELTEYILSLDLEQQMELLAEMGKSQRGEPNRLAELLPAWDSSSVDESKLGKYTPGYMSEQEWEARQAKEAASKPAPAPPAVSAPITDLGDVLKPPSLDDLLAPAASASAAAPPSALEDPLQWLSELSSAAPEVEGLPSISFEALNQNLADLPQPAVEDDPLTWLSSLSELTPTAPEPIEGLDTGMFNLRSLTELAESVVISQANANDDINWLESIARASGADEAELVTAADMPLPPPASVTVDGPGYQPYSFESAYTADESLSAAAEESHAGMAVPDVNSFEDPELWLDALAAGVSAQRDDAEPADRGTTAAQAVIPDDPMEVMRALNAGVEVPPQAVESFFEKMFERAEQMPDEPELANGDLPPIEVEIPDWLQESFASVDQDDAFSDIPMAQMLKDLGLTDDSSDAAPMLVDLQSAPPTPLDWQVEIQDAPDPAELDLNELITSDEVEAAALDTVEIPSWLLEQAGELSDDMSDIFADEHTALMELSQPALVIDDSDPWVQAFAEESSHPEMLEAWYNQRIAQISGVEEAPQAEPAAVETAASGLRPAQLPQETALEPALPVAVPSWLHGEPVEPTPQAGAEWFETDEEPIPSWLQAQVAEELAPTDPLPDWLAGADLTNTEVPQWLLQTVEEKPSAPAEPAPAAPPAPPAALPVVERPAAPPPAPARVVVGSQLPVQAAAHLEQARQQMATDVNVSLQHYEAVVRANVALDEVVRDLSRAIADKAHKTNPAVYRVLGDALMRQGKLQDALSTYRKALNLLG
jgi:hypothetical protein